MVAGMAWEQARAVGDAGEGLVQAHVERLGWEVLDRNWRSPGGGELDLVALEGAELVFCEVKTRRSVRFGEPVEQVTPQKARRLRRLAWDWLAAHERRGGAFRIDVVGVLLRPGEEPELRHLRAVA